MSRGERLAPVAAGIGAVSTLLCCLPLSLMAAMGTAGIGVMASQYRTWLIGASVVLLIFGFFQVYRKPANCGRRSRLSLSLLWASAVLVAVVFLMPQLVAALLADLLG